MPSRCACGFARGAMAGNGRADFTQDGRFRVMVLLATFASLRWGEVTALTRGDVDLKAGTVRVRAVFTHSDPGTAHGQVRWAEPGALVFCGPSGVPLRRSNFGKMSGWPHAVRSIGAEGLHFHNLRHTGGTFAATGRAGIRDLMARMGHDSERAALIYQHQAPGADKIKDRPSGGHAAQMVHVARAGPIERWPRCRESAPNGESGRLSSASALRLVADGQSNSGLARHQRPQDHFSSAAVPRTVVSGLVVPSAQPPAVRCFHHGHTGV